MKRKLSFLVAAVMVLSMLPAAGVLASTKNSVTTGGNKDVADDYAWSRNPGAAPYVTIKEDSDSAYLLSNGTILVSVDNSEFELDKIGKLDSNDYGYQEGDLAWRDASDFGVYDEEILAEMMSQGVHVSFDGYDKLYITGYDYLTAVQGTGKRTGTISKGEILSTPIANGGAQSAVLPTGAYTIQYISDHDAEIQVYDNTTALAAEIEMAMGWDPGDVKDQNLTGLSYVVPLMVKMNGTGPATVSITDNGNTNVTESTNLTYARGTEGTTTVSIDSTTTTFSKTLEVPDIIVKETVPGTFGNSKTNLITLTAPNGFQWTSAPKNSDPFSTSDAYVLPYLGFGSGNQKDYDYTAWYSRLSSDKSIIEIDTSEVNGGSWSITTGTAGAFRIHGLILERTDSAADTPTGPVNVKVAVEHAGTSYVQVGIFGQKAVTMTIQDKAVPELITGAYPKDYWADSIRALDVTITENQENAWNSQSDMILTLTDGAKFRAVDVTKASGFKSTGVTSSSDVYFEGGFKNAVNHTEEGALVLEDTKLTIKGSKNLRTEGKKLELTFRVYLSLKPGFRGDVELKSDADNEAFSSVSGVIAKAVDPFVVSIKSSDIQIGYMSIPLGDITIKENQAGALKKKASGNYESKTGGDGYTFRIGGFAGYGGVAFKDEGKEEVVSGDIVIDKYETVDANDYYSLGNALNLVVKRESTKPSEVKLSGMTMDANRSIPEGKLELRIGGLAVANYYDGSVSDYKDYGNFDQSYYTVKDYINVVTAAPDKDTKYTTEVAVTVGSKTILANNKEYTMDVAPFNDNGYVMVPTRAVAVALGISDNMILWNPPSKTVSILDTNRGRNSQFQVGSNFIVQNGIQIPFEGPSCKVVDSRTFLPFRALGEIVLGCPVSWDQATTTAYFNRSAATGVVNQAANNDTAAASGATVETTATETTTATELTTAE